MRRLQQPADCGRVRPTHTPRRPAHVEFYRNALAQRRPHDAARDLFGNDNSVPHVDGLVDGLCIVTIDPFHDTVCHAQSHGDEP